MKYLDVKVKEKTIKIPYLHYTGDKKGKTAVISGGMHGDELNGMMLVRKFIEHCDENEIEKKLKGELIILPVLNVDGFKKQTRVVPTDRRDLNRSFNKRTKSDSNIIANALEENFFSKADLAIDCHDSGKRSILIPHPRIHKFEDNYCSRCTREIAIALGLKIVIERVGKKGMLAIELTNKYRIPIVTLEMGGALKVDYKFLDQSLKGIINVLKHYEMLPGEAVLPKKQFFLRDRFGVPALQGGIVTFKKKLGQRVHRGTVLGNLYNPTKNKIVDIVSPMCGIIFSMQHVDSVRKGEIIYSILEDKMCHTFRRKTIGMVEEVKNIRM
ncbi:hypothetical protein GF354_00070 [Candidatus Peregrinibacteria bacterium]|nr:hypothetical protein [Candidatus Peregrinibacteria bacterium]